MDLYPAIDLRGGQVVRLAQGEATRETVYGHDPVAQAEEFVVAGARWLHIVDLNRAFGDGDNDSAIAEIARRFGDRLRLQLGGGIRDVARAEAVVQLGVSRVVIGTAAVDQPALVDAVVRALGGDRVAVGIDARDGRVAVRGWVETSAVRATELAARVAAQGVQTVIHTDIARDGMLSGPNLDEALALQAKGPRVIVSGGVASVADLRAVASAGLAGAITGRAIYEGRFTLTEALAALAS
ncbi:MAG: 1-(5-phosphoribosyl)-5-[(5-phosphoribosylamino)methylideneamino]imidazole-4-carboxamide isomerase [Gemmatimonadales bacterium]